MEWSYSGKTGPDQWHSLCEDFQKAELESPMQSPIALKTVAAQQAANKSETFAYKPQKMTFATSFVNHTIHLRPANSEVETEAIFEGKSYFLEDIHAHLPSEHTIDEKYFQLEIHFVHRSKDNEVLVIGVMAEAENMNRETRTMDAYAQFFAKENLEQHHQVDLDVEEFMPKNSSFFHYTGSLTTPPTLGPIQWIVMDTAIALPDNLISGFEKAIGKTNRPIQADLNRAIYLHI